MWKCIAFYFSWAMCTGLHKDENIGSFLDRSSGRRACPETQDTFWRSPHDLWCRVTRVTKTTWPTGKATGKNIRLNILNIFFTESLICLLRFHVWLRSCLYRLRHQNCSHRLTLCDCNRRLNGFWIIVVYASLSSTRWGGFDPWCCLIKVCNTRGLSQNHISYLDAILP
jgi:hypothetical protein